MTKLDVCIIGGGLSGLTATSELYRQLGSNVKVTIIERESQLGGRVLTKKFNDCSIELGAQFFVDQGYIHHLIQSIGLKSEVIPLSENFISLYYGKKVYHREQLHMIHLFQGKGEFEKEQLLTYAKDVNPREELISYSFEEWYQTTVGGDLLPIWNRMLQLIGIRNAESINAHFGLTLINVFFGKNYLLKGGLHRLIDLLEEKISSCNGEILKGAECTNIEKRNNQYLIKFVKNGKTYERFFDSIISALPPEELIKIFENKALKPLEKIEGHPMALYVIQSKIRLWDKTWGLIIGEESPIYGLCDWKNVTKAQRETPLLAICSPFVNRDEIILELRNLFPNADLKAKIIFEKKWTLGLHQPNAEFFKIRKKVLEGLPDGFYLAGDWMILPALEGAVISGRKSAELLIGDIGKKI